MKEVNRKWAGWVSVDTPSKQVPQFYAATMVSGTLDMVYHTTREDFDKATAKGEILVFIDDDWFGDGI